MRSLFNRVKGITGIYGLGFDRDSVLGIMLPVGIVVLIAGLGIAVNLLFMS